MKFKQVLPEHRVAAQRLRGHPLTDLTDAEVEARVAAATTQEILAEILRNQRDIMAVLAKLPR